MLASKGLYARIKLYGSQICRRVEDMLSPNQGHKVSLAERCDVGSEAPTIFEQKQGFQSFRQLFAKVLLPCYL